VNGEFGDDQNGTTGREVALRLYPEDADSLFPVEVKP
jgi:hypothetical protein